MAAVYAVSAGVSFMATILTIVALTPYTKLENTFRSVLPYYSWLIPKIITLSCASALTFTLCLHILWILVGAVEISIAVNSFSVSDDTGFERKKALNSVALHDLRTPSIQANERSHGEARQLLNIDDVRNTARIYKPLPESKIRLLVSKPCYDGPLKYNLIYVPLQAVRGTYTALSYCWGTGAAAHVIHLNNRPVKIRTNLYGALLYLQSTHRKVIWVDALCIDQNNHKERSAQVMRMRAIYAGARDVIAWLSPTIQEAQMLSDGLQSAPSSDIVLHGSHLANSIIATEYWCRIWILQEFAAASKLEIVLGHTALSLGSLENLLRKHSETGTPSQVSSHGLRKVFRVRHSWQTFSELTLLELLEATKTSTCSVRLDRVYAIMALARDGRSFLSEPSYAADEWQMSVSMTLSYLENTESCLDIILLGPYFACEHLPSWCPNYFRFDQPSVLDSTLRYVRDSVSDRFFHGRLYQTPHLQEPSDVKQWSPWAATAHSRLRIHITATSIESAARKVGVVASLGWIVSDGDSTEFPISDTVVGLDPYGTKILTALWSLIILGLAQYDRKTREEILGNGFAYIYYTLRAFASDLPERHPEMPFTDFSKWISRNRHFEFLGKPLRQHGEALQSILAYPTFWLWPFVPFESFGGEGEVDTADGMRRCVSRCELRNQALLDLPLRILFNSSMRLANIGQCKIGEVVGWVYPDGRIGDEIFLLPGCSMPVVLRRQDEDSHFVVVGEALVPGSMDGNLWLSYKDEELEKITII